MIGRNQMRKNKLTPDVDDRDDEYLMVRDKTKNKHARKNGKQRQLKRANRSLKEERDLS